MTVSVSSGSLANSSDVEKVDVSGGLQKTLENSGRLPPITLLVKPLDGRPTVTLNRFLDYGFKSSVIVPVDTFSFSAVAPDDEKPIDSRIKDGDIVVLQANGRSLAVGIIDVVEVETDEQFGEKVMISGRDLMGQLEDHDAISIDDKPIWANKFTVDQVIRQLIENTRIPSSVLYRDVPKQPYLFATEPGESKLSALQRFLEPLNCLAWMSVDGKISVGRPNMSQKASGTLFQIKSQRKSNVRSMTTQRASATIPNIIVPVWSGQETTTDRVEPSQRLYNAARGPSRLRKLGHRLPKTVVVSTPSGSDPQELAGINAIEAGGSNLLQAYAKRELARRNRDELVVHAVVIGHFNDNGEHYHTDHVYRVIHERGNVNEDMYLYEVEYKGGESTGQQTTLSFCRLGTIVSDVRAP